MDELISKKAAIDALKEHRALYCDNTPDAFSKLSHAEKSRVDELDTAIATLVNLPPAEPKRGRWILDRSGAYCCSECMEPCAGYVMMKPRDKYCKMCGAKMEVTT